VIRFFQQKEAKMKHPFWLNDRQWKKLEALLPVDERRRRVDDRRIISGIIYVIKNGLQWKDAPPSYGPHKTLYNRFVRWSRKGVFNYIFAELASMAGVPDRLMIDATHLKAHRTAASLLKKGLFPAVSDARKVA
jgi:transposase